MEITAFQRCKFLKEFVENAIDAYVLVRNASQPTNSYVIGTATSSAYTADGKLHYTGTPKRSTSVTYKFTKYEVDTSGSGFTYRNTAYKVYDIGTGQNDSPDVPGDIASQTGGVGLCAEIVFDNSTGGSDIPFDTIVLVSGGSTSIANARLRLVQFGTMQAIPVGAKFTYHLIMNF